jgi:16S rRNA G966 N2-methylase RsmD
MRAAGSRRKQVAVVESEARDSFEPPDGFTLVDERRYGKAKIRFLRKDG